MNRRESFRLTAMAGIAALLPVSHVAASTDGDIQPCGLCPMTEALAHEMMEETGEWKEGIWDRRKGQVPFVITRRGCCACEVTLEQGARHPNWTYRMRRLSEEEKAGFHKEYGDSASLLLSATVGGKYQIRGFILNGRHEGWNASARQA